LHIHGPAMVNPPLRIIYLRMLYTYLETESTEAECRAKPVVLTDDNISEFSITDIVLPLPGHAVQYPDNETAEWYRELLTADGFEDCSFRNRVK